MIAQKQKLLTVALFAGLSLSANAQVGSTTTVSGNVGNWVSTATRVGTAPSTQRVAIVVHLAFRDPDALQSLAKEISDPASQSYGQYLTPAAISERFAPTASSAAAVESLLKSAGMTDITTGPANAYISATATVGQVRSTFGVSQELYQVGTKRMRANREAPKLPAALAGKVLFIEGLDEFSTFKQPHHRSVTQNSVLVAPAAKKSATANSLVTTEASADTTPPPVADNLPSPYCSNYYGDTKAALSTQPAPYNTTVPWLVCGYTPQQIQQAYGLDRVSENGAGVTVAIIDAYASPTIKADVNQYSRNHALTLLTNSNFRQIVPAGIYNVDPTEACGPYGWWGEESLDVAAVHGAAPGADIVYVGARDCNTSLTVALVNTIINHTADIITNSYGYNGEGLSASSVKVQDQAFEIAALLGETVVFSSGDDGDLALVNGIATGSFPATSPFVTAVGGTSLGLTSPTGKSEWGWGTDRAYLANASVNSASSVTTSGLTQTSNYGYTYPDFSFYAGSGGGISLLESQPAYQKGVVPKALAKTVSLASGYSVTLPKPARVTPDVSMVADPYTGYLYGESYTIANNSASDSGCVPTAGTVEYCEFSIGGTSLASPLMAGMFAVMDQARKGAQKPFVGFANPLLYGLKVGSSLTSGPINDVVAPAAPTSMLRGYVTNSHQVRLITINSIPFNIITAPFPLITCTEIICEGVDGIFNYVTPGYDNVTGLGVPYAPKLIKK